MSNPSKRKGTLYESQCRDYLRERLPWLDIDRRILHGNKDTGDINGLFLDVPHDKPVRIVMECKNTPQALNLPLYLRQTRQEAVNDGIGSIGVLTSKRRYLHTYEQPVIVRNEDCWIFGNSLRGVVVPLIKAVSKNEIYEHALRRLAVDSSVTGKGYRWYWKGPLRQPLIIISMGVFVRMLKTWHEKAAHALA